MSAAKPPKNKTTVYMSSEDELMLDEVFIKRIRARNRPDRSTLLCEGIRLLYNKEFPPQKNTKPKIEPEDWEE